MILRPSVRCLLPKIKVYTTKLNFSFAVTSQMVQELRKKSGAPMMDCKKALAAAEVAGDPAKAMDWLRAKGGNMFSLRVSHSLTHTLTDKHTHKYTYTYLLINANTSTRTHMYTHMHTYARIKQE